MNTKTLKNSWTVILLILSVITIYWVQSNGKKKYNTFYENEINGVIEAIRYGDKKQAIVKIKNEEYSLLLFGIRKGEDLNKGDSLYKAKKSKRLELHSKSASGGFIFTKIYQMK